ncbi:hypothetical protein [Nocardioides ferulae]|uniref:divisome protein SepX/GlpR n=1 Tax=Nocardioides ferulae TaxID=2340821 RepID=UPI000EAE1BCC|nr:hypothetical protein [Nocardioides ferulae]
MDPSALIFVALAVAWAAYLIPKALHHHEEVARSRSVDRFSHTMRVLARREPVDARSARLVVTPGRPATATSVVTKPRSSEAETPAEAPVEAPAEKAVPTQPAAGRSAGARREAANRAARRRRRVLLGVLALNLLVVALAAFAVLAWWWVAAPATLLVAWLVACRLMVKRERRAPASRMPIQIPAEEPAAPVAPVEDAETGPMQRVEDQPPVVLPMTDPTLWEPVPVTLPTYVSKPAASRTVRTIDLDSTGVWTSGRTEGDAQIARDAEAADRAARAAQDDAERAVGS